jgi:uncharacterized membrane protein YhaH (DUF805 family)
MLWGLVLVNKAPGITAIWLACFLITNAVGTSLWIRRDHIRPYPAIQCLLAVIGVSGLLALLAFDWLGGVDAWAAVGIEKLGVPGNGGWSELRTGYLCLLLGVPAMMVYFGLIEHAGKKAQSRMESASQA